MLQNKALGGADSPLRGAEDTTHLPSLPPKLAFEAAPCHQQWYEVPCLLSAFKETTTALLSSYHFRTGQAKASSTSLILLNKPPEYRDSATNTQLNNSTSYHSHKPHLTQDFFLFWRQCLALPLKGKPETGVRLFPKVPATSVLPLTK